MAEPTDIAAASTGADDVSVNPVFAAALAFFHTGPCEGIRGCGIKEGEPYVPVKCPVVIGCPRRPPASHAD